VFAEIIAAATGYEQPNRPHLPRSGMSWG